MGWPSLARSINTGRRSRVGGLGVSLYLALTNYDLSLALMEGTISDWIQMGSGPGPPWNSYTSYLSCHGYTSYLQGYAMTSRSDYPTPENGLEPLTAAERSLGASTYARRFARRAVNAVRAAGGRMKRRLTGFKAVGLFAALAGAVGALAPPL